MGTADQTRKKMEYGCFINIFGQLTNKFCSLNVWYRTLVSFNFSLLVLTSTLHCLKWEARKHVWQKFCSRIGFAQLIDSIKFTRLIDRNTSFSISCIFTRNLITVYFIWCLEGKYNFVILYCMEMLLLLTI